MAKKSQDKEADVLQGLQELVDAGKVEEVEQVLTTLVESEPAEDETPEQRETRSYAEGMRDGLSLARGITSESSP